MFYSRTYLRYLVLAKWANGSILDNCDLDYHAHWGALNKCLALVVLLVICLSGGVYSWWKTSLFTFICSSASLIVLFVYSLMLEGSTAIFKYVLVIQQLEPEMRWLCWSVAANYAMGVLFLSRPAYEVISPKLPS